MQDITSLHGPCIGRAWDSCIDDYVEGLAFPMCGKHALTFMRQLREAIDRRRIAYGNTPTHPRAGVQPDPLNPRRDRIYYLLIDGLIKIGYTGDLEMRLRAYPPTAQLLVTEHGDMELEQRRHRQFRRTLTSRREWFEPSAELWAHIKQLRGDVHESADWLAYLHNGVQRST